MVASILEADLGKTASGGFLGFDTTAMVDIDENDAIFYAGRKCCDACG